MISAEHDLREFIKTYFYGTVNDEVVAMDAEALVDYMRQRGWHWDRVPAEPQS